MLKPRIILVTQFYDPEPAYKGQAFAKAISEAGYEVEVVTGFPNFPEGMVYDGYSIRPIQRSKNDGVYITRLALYPSHDGSKFGRVLNYISFMLSVFIYLTFFARRANLIWAYHPPLTVGLAAAAARFFRRTPVVLDIHDLWPEAISATGIIQSPRILKLVETACNWTYRRVQHIILHSNGFRDELIHRGVPSEKMTAIIGWTHEPSRKFASLRFPETMKNLRGLKIIYAGNIGPAQALESVLDTAKILESTGHVNTATFCILGSGISLDALKDKARSLGLTNVVFIPRVPQPEVDAYLAAADVLLMHLRDVPIYSLNMPSKTQAYMLAKKPILVGGRGEVVQFITETKSGVSVPPENPEAMADAVLSLASMPARKRDEFGNNAYSYYWSELCMEKGIAKFLEVFDRTRRP